MAAKSPSLARSILADVPMMMSKPMAVVGASMAEDPAVGKVRLATKDWHCDATAPEIAVLEASVKPESEVVICDAEAQPKTACSERVNARRYVTKIPSHAPSVTNEWSSWPSADCRDPLLLPRDNLRKQANEVARMMPTDCQTFLFHVPFLDRR
jgi:hypothetical protein